MRTACILLLNLAIFCKDTATAQQHNRVNWIQQFKEFRDAVYHHNKNKVRSFIDFPIMNENNEIWHLVYDGNEKQISHLTKEIKPFTGQDFEKYFDKIFSKKFTSIITKLKPEELNKKDEIQTVEIKGSRSTAYKMYAAIDTADRTFTLNLSFISVSKDRKGKLTERPDSNVFYMFDLLENGKLKFRQIRLAG